MTVAAALRAGLVAPDVRAHVREAEPVAELGDVAGGLAGLVRAGDPVEVFGDKVGHRYAGKKHSTRISCSVTSCGVPNVVTVEK